jgi:hypothetical protein
MAAMHASGSPISRDGFHALINRIVNILEISAADWRKGETRIDHFRPIYARLVTMHSYMRLIHRDGGSSIITHITRKIEDK